MTANRRPIRALFVCNQNRLRSPTAQQVFGNEPTLEVRSAGVDRDATVPLTRDLLEWADVVFVMEWRQRNVIHKRYRDLYASKQIICLYIPDTYAYMDNELVVLLRQRVSVHLEELDARRE